MDNNNSTSVIMQTEFSRFPISRILDSNWSIHYITSKFIIIIAQYTVHGLMIKNSPRIFTFYAENVQIGESMIYRIKRILKNLQHYFTKTVEKPVYIPVMEGNILKDKVVFITGATGGIGFAICEACIRNGATVVVAGRDVNKVKEKCDLLEKKYRCAERIISAVFDINEEIDKVILNTAQKAKAKKIDVLINSIGISIGNTFLYTTGADYDAVLNSNLKSTYFISQSFAKFFIKNKICGNILNISSVSGSRPANSPYMLSKWAMNGLTKGMAKQLAKYDIVVNSIAPGPTATPMLKLDGSDLLYEKAPLRRFTDPVEVANLAVFLISDMGRMITGETVSISGGCGTLTFDDIPY